jgi:hypothetical protein
MSWYLGWTVISYCWGWIMIMVTINLSPWLSSAWSPILKGSGALAIGLEFDRRAVMTKSGATGGRSRHHGLELFRRHRE